MVRLQQPSTYARQRALRGRRWNSSEQPHRSGDRHSDDAPTYTLPMYFLLYGHARTSAHAPRPNTGTLPVHRAPFYTKTSCCCWCWKGLSLTLPLSARPFLWHGIGAGKSMLRYQNTNPDLVRHAGGQSREEHETRSRRGGDEAFIGSDWMWALEWHRMEWSNNLRQSLVRHAIGFSNDWWGYQRNFPFASTSSAGHWDSLSNLSSLFLFLSSSLSSAEYG